MKSIKQKGKIKREINPSTFLPGEKELIERMRQKMLDERAKKSVGAHVSV
ncbi:MAG: hypothetical protein WCT04_19125 [Planctomycetota bacterium]